VGPLAYGDRPIEIEVTPSTTIAEVKREIRDRWGIPLAQHRIYGENDDVAQLCGVTASQLGIEAEGFVRLRVKAVGRLYVRADTLDGGFASIYALSSYTVARVKEMVQQETGFLPHRQRLMVDDHELKAGYLWNHVNERSCSILLGLKRPLRVGVRDSANTVVHLTAAPCISVESIRHALWRKGYDRNSRLSFNGRHLAKDERLSDRTLSAVRRGAELAVDDCVRGSPFTIFVKDLCGRSLKITCYDHYKTEDVKARIEDLQGIPPEAQRLCYSIHQLEDGRSLHDYGITGDSTLHLVPLSTLCVPAPDLPNDMAVHLLSSCAALKYLFLASAGRSSWKVEGTLFDSAACHAGNTVRGTSEVSLKMKSSRLRILHHFAVLKPGCMRIRMPNTSVGEVDVMEDGPSVMPTFFFLSEADRNNSAVVVDAGTSQL
ncbi:hypothetical protein FOZ63_003213, partial [Perkinsus olseni]